MRKKLSYIAFAASLIGALLWYAAMHKTEIVLLYVKHVVRTEAAPNQEVNWQPGPGPVAALEHLATAFGPCWETAGAGGAGAQPQPGAWRR